MMTDDGLLSQEEIDALTAGLTKAKSAPAVSSLSSIDPEVARPLINLVCDQAGSIITTVVGKSVDIRLQTLQPFTLEMLKALSGSESLQCKVSFSKDLKGNLYLIITKTSAALLSDLMMMGDGSAPFEEEQKDAVSELLNQVMGSSTTAITSNLYISVSIGQTITEDFNSKFLALDGSCLGVCANMIVDGFPEHKVLWVLDEELAISVKKSCGGKESNFTVPSPAAPAESGLGSYTESSPATQNANFSASGSSGIAGVFGSTGNKALDLLMDIELPITIELGRTQMSLKRILEMGPGAIVEMDRFAGEPVDILINGKVVARGEVVVVDENFGVRVVSLVTPEERLKMLR